MGSLAACLWNRTASHGGALWEKSYHRCSSAGRQSDCGDAGHELGACASGGFPRKAVFVIAAVTTAATWLALSPWGLGRSLLAGMLAKRLGGGPCC